MKDENVLMRKAEAARRTELAQLDDQLCNVRALFAIAVFTAIASFFFGVKRDSTLLAAVGCLSVAAVCWCLIRQYRLVRERDQLARTLSWVGLDDVDAPQSQGAAKLTSARHQLASTRSNQSL
jgi:hypothetical protein